MNEKSVSPGIPWTRLENGNVLHKCGIELETNGYEWRMTDASGLDFAVFTMMEQQLSADEAKGLADLLIEQGSNWATRGLH